MSEAVELAAAEVAIATVRERTTRASQVVTMIAIVVPPLGIIAVAVGLWGIAFSWVDLAVFLALYVLTGLGTTVGFHRLFTHRSFETTKPVRATFAILGSMTLQGPVTQWVTDHRKHHALSDQEGDPHSPHAGFAPNVWGAREGLLPRSHGLAVPPQGHGARRALRQGSLRRHADPADRPDVLRLGRRSPSRSRSRSGTPSAGRAGSSASRRSSGAA